MRIVPPAVFVLLIGACHDPGHADALTPSNGVPPQLPVSTTDTSAREQALIRALKSRYPTEQHEALMLRITPPAGTTALVELNDPESQRLFDQIRDVRLAVRNRERSGTPNNNIRRVIVTLPLADHTDGKVLLIRRPPAIISGEMVDEQHVLVVPPNAQSTTAVEAILAVTARQLRSLVAHGPADTIRTIEWRQSALVMRSPTMSRNLASSAVRDIPGVGFGRTFPAFIDLTTP